MNSATRTIAGTGTALLSLLLIAVGLTSKPSRALPVYARQYDVTCDTCHSVAPHLNAFGMAFQANHFNWPGGNPPRSSSPLRDIPLSGMATFSRFDDISFDNRTDTNFRTLEIYLTSGFGAKSRNGGFFLDDFLAVKDTRAGNLENAFLSLPVAGSRGQYAVTAGQFTPMMYQYDPLNSLTQTLPAAFADGVDAFSLADANPGVRLDFFDHRGTSSATGSYVTVGVPFHGHLTLNSDSHLYGPRGFFIHAFQRSGASSLGLFSYSHSGSYLDGVMATQQVNGKLDLLEAGSLGHDRFTNNRLLSLEANYAACEQLALTGRIESVAVSGQRTELYPVVGLTCYPFRNSSAMRLAAETTQERGNRSVILFLFGQF